MNSSIHIRRCHLCGAISEAPGQLVTSCQGCGKALAPFYFFDESKALGLAVSTFSESTVLPRKEYPPVWGLTVYWES